MEIFTVVAAGLASFVFGAIWYSVLAKPWMAASGVELDEKGRPANRSNPLPYITAVIGAILIAGMMRHVLVLSGIDGPIQGLVAGLGIGLFVVTPWLATFYGFSGRPMRLLAIDGGYATLGSGLIGLVLIIL
ncbi:MAG: DUF1761 domain-containing protein [Paracoccaceae bacterium]